LLAAAWYRCSSSIMAPLNHHDGPNTSGNRTSTVARAATRCGRRAPLPDAAIISHERDNQLQ
jgi:hypothetical protein